MRNRMFRLNEYILKEIKELEQEIITEESPEEHKYLLYFIFLGEYSIFLRNFYLENLIDTFGVSVLVEQTVELTLEYLKTGVDQEIKDKEFKGTTKQIINKYEDYLEYTNKYNYSGVIIK